MIGGEYPKCHRCYAHFEIRCMNCKREYTTIPGGLVHPALPAYCLEQRQMISNNELSNCPREDSKK